MLTLSLDSSAKAASVALHDDNKLLGEFFIDTDFTHSRTLAPMIEQLLLVTGKTTEDIDLIAVSNGPGSFTGVRIGVALAKGIAFVKDISCFAVSTLESMAYNLRNTDCVVCGVMDARRNQVYNALFKVSDGDVHRICDDRAISLEELKSEIADNYSDARVILVGDGAAITMDAFGELSDFVEIAPYNIRMQRASSVGQCAICNISKGASPIKASELLPSYLRLSQAERERKERENNEKNKGE